MNTILGKKQNLLIVFDGMIADMISNKELSQVATELFIHGRRLNVSTVLISHIAVIYHI